MAKYLSFDEINALGYQRRSEPIDEYFLVMDIPAPALERRVAIARRIKNAVIGYLEVINDYIDTFGDYAFDIAGVYLERGLREAIEDSGHEMDDYLEEYVILTAKKINDTSRRHIKPIYEESETDEAPEGESEDTEEESKELPYGLYFDSEDRAEFIAEDEANTVEGYEDFIVALDRGFTMKYWHTMRDKRVRPTHQEVEGDAVPIGEMFSVGYAMLMFPRDTVNGADFPEETAGCRCWLTFGG